MLKLVIEDGDGTTHVVPIIRDQITIGREEGNTIRLTERNVSRHHARLTRSAGEIGTTVILEDLASYNGVRVNGALVTCKQTLVPEDTMQIGDYFIAIDSDEKNTVVSSVLDATSTELDNTEEINPTIEEKDQGWLVVVSSNLAGTCYWLNRREMLIGRSDIEGNDLVVKHRSISRHHAKMIFRDGGYTLVDLASSNGVLVNTVASGTTSIVNGDIIEMGHVKLRYCAPGDSYVFQMTDIDDVVVVSTGKPLRMMVTLGILALITAASFLLTSANDTDNDRTRDRSAQKHVKTTSAPDVSKASDTTHDMSNSVDENHATPRELLAEARRWASMQEWKTASGVCARLIEDTQIDPSIKLAALQLQKQTNQETINLRRLDRLKALDSALDDESAMASELPTTDSFYFDSAQNILNRVQLRRIETVQSQFEINVDDGAWRAARSDLSQMERLGTDTNRLKDLKTQLNDAMNRHTRQSAAQRETNPQATRSPKKKKQTIGSPMQNTGNGNGSTFVNAAKRPSSTILKTTKPSRVIHSQEKPSPELNTRRQSSQLKIFEAAWRIATKDTGATRQTLYDKSKALCNLTDEMNLRKKAIMYCAEQAKYEKNIQIKRGLERKVQKWKQ